MVTLLLVQRLSCGPIWWAVFLIVGFIAARYLPWWGFFAGHAAVSLLVVILDLHWIQSEMKRPDWSGVPDQDLVFSMGVMFRLFLINICVLPVTGLGVRLNPRAQVAAFGVESSTPT